MDAVMRDQALKVGLEPGDVMPVVLLAARPGRAAAELAFYSGRTRQQLHTTLLSLEQRGLVTPQAVEGGRVTRWALTGQGLVLGHRLQVRLGAFERLFETRVDVPELAASLQRVVESVVNRPSTKGWRQGLVVPPEARADPEWDRGVVAGVEPGEASGHPRPAHAADPNDPSRRGAGRRGARVAGPVSGIDSSVDVEALIRAWRAIWDPPGD